MKVLLVNGSPKGHGSTYRALAEIAGQFDEAGIETEIFHIGHHAINGCMGCRYCKDHPGKCAQNDIVNEAIKKFIEADAIIVGSPVHYAASSGSLTCFMDRVFYSSSSFLCDKPAASIVVLRRGGATAALEQLNKYFMIANMPVISSQYWNMVHGNNPDEISQDFEGLQTMRTLAQNMIWVMRCIEAADKAGVPRPFRENKIQTNFINL